MLCTTFIDVSMINYYDYFKNLSTAYSSLSCQYPHSYLHTIYVFVFIWSVLSERNSMRSEIRPKNLCNFEISFQYLSDVWADRSNAAFQDEHISWLPNQRHVTAGSDGASCCCWRWVWRQWCQCWWWWPGTGTLSVILITRW